VPGRPGGHVPVRGLGRRGPVNRGEGAATVSTTATQVGLTGGSFALTDLWTGAITAAGTTTLIWVCHAAANQPA
jgi:alpha-galactosidase